MENLQGLEREAIVEEDLLHVLAIKKSTLDRLRREQGLPFVKLGSNARIYLEADVLKWLREHMSVMK